LSGNQKSGVITNPLNYDRLFVISMEKLHPSLTFLDAESQI
jgi:hypothetical protein